MATEQLRFIFRDTGLFLGDIVELDVHTFPLVTLVLEITQNQVPSVVVQVLFQPLKVDFKLGLHAKCFLFDLQPFQLVAFFGLTDDFQKFGWPLEGLFYQTDSRWLLRGVLACCHCGQVVIAEQKQGAVF